MLLRAAAAAAAAGARDPHGAALAGAEAAHGAVARLRRLVLRAAAAPGGATVWLLSAARLRGHMILLLSFGTTCDTTIDSGFNTSLSLSKVLIVVTFAVIQG